jgi:hypothetical protein
VVNNEFEYYNHIDTSYNYNQEIISRIQLRPNNLTRLQKNTIHAYQSSFFNFKESLNKYYWNSFMLLGKYINTRVINEFISNIKEIFNRSVELVQKYLP